MRSAIHIEERKSGRVDKIVGNLMLMRETCSGGSSCLGPTLASGISLPADRSSCFEALYQTQSLS
jgi:hypothetical protein